MPPSDTNRNREIILAPTEYVYVSGEKGDLKCYVGPLRLEIGANERPVTYDHRTKRYVETATLSEAKQYNVEIGKGSYAVLKNPAKGNEEHPSASKGNPAVDLVYGEQVVIHGPDSFSLWPGQSAEVREGHSLQNNQYLQLRITDPVQARASWNSAVVGLVPQPTITPVKPKEGEVVTTAAAALPPDPIADSTNITRGQKIHVLGTRVAFYMPPSQGVEVVQDEDENGLPSFVRDALTLSLEEYCKLKDENGNKRYPKGPMVVFPKPTEVFETVDGLKTFRAITMNELQGLHLMFSQDVTLVYRDGSKHDFKAGDEVFITGKEMPKYYPEEGHTQVAYDGKSLHYSVMVPEGEARYVANRKTGVIETVLGPTMLLPDPTLKIIALRPLSEQQVKDWFPGPDGRGSPMALEWNQYLRRIAGSEPTTRSGSVSLERAERGLDDSGGTLGRDVVMNYMSETRTGGGVSGGYTTSSAAPSAPATRSARGDKGLERSSLGKSQGRGGAEATERSGTFNEPRTLVLGNKFKGAVGLDIYAGYAISRVKGLNGEREVIQGPKKIFLDYSDTLDVLEMSTGTPKTADHKVRVAYLQITENRMSDQLIVESSDNVKLQVTLSYIVNFEGNPSKWFSVNDPVKLLTDHGRSILRGAVHKISFVDFMKNSTDILRDIILGSKPEGGTRPGFSFEANGMRATDLEILEVKVVDNALAQLSYQSQRDVVAGALNVMIQEQKLAASTRLEEIARGIDEAKTKTALLAEQRKQDLLQMQDITLGHQLEMDRTQADHSREIQRLNEEQRLEFEKAKVELQMTSLAAETQAVVARFEKVVPGFTEALLALKDASVLEKVAGALSAQQLFGGNTAVEVFQRAVTGTPLEALFQKVANSAGTLQNGNGKTSSPTQPHA